MMSLLHIETRFLLSMLFILYHGCRNSRAVPREELKICNKTAHFNFSCRSTGLYCTWDQGQSHVTSSDADLECQEGNPTLKCSIQNPTGCWQKVKIKKCTENTQWNVEVRCGNETIPQDEIITVRKKRKKMSQTRIEVPMGDSKENISFEQAVNLLKNLSFLADQLGNFDTGTIKTGNTTGIVAKLKKNQRIMSFGRRDTGDVVVSQKKSFQTTFSQTVEIPEEASAMAVDRNSTMAAVLFFPGMQQQDDTSSSLLGNQVIGIEMGTRISNLTHPIKICFSQVEKKGNIFSCISWDGEGGAPVWVTDGCETQTTNSTITCLCSHLTFFAILVSPAPETLSASDLKSLTTITSIGCGLSLFFQVVALCMHYLIRKQKSNAETDILIQLFIAMFAMNLSFLVNESVANLGNAGACVTIAAVLHYSLLATFTWFFMQALHLFIKFWKIHSEIKHYMKKICVAGWVTPAVVVSILLILQKYELLHISTIEGEEVNMCWISDAAVHQGVNIGYYSLVFIFTFTIFIMVVRQIALYRSTARMNPDKSSVQMKVSSILALFCLLGLTWAFAFFSHGPLMLPFYYIFTILNAFQGFFLFIYYYKSSKVFGDHTDHASRSSTTNTSKTDVNVKDDAQANQSDINSKPST